MYPSLCDGACLTIMDGGRRRVDFPRYKGVSMRPRRGAPGGICEKAGGGRFRKLENTTDTSLYEVNLIVGIFTRAPFFGGSELLRGSL